MSARGAFSTVVLSAGIAVASIMGAGVAHSATLVGQEVTCAFNVSFTCSPSSFTVTAGDPNPDAQVFAPFSTPILDIDFMDGWVDITYNDETSITFFGTGWVLTLSGLLPASGAETSLYNLSITNIPGLTSDDFSLSGGVLAIDLSDSVWSAANGSAVGFDIAVPLPVSAVLLLAGLAGLGLVGRRKASA